MNIFSGSDIRKSSKAGEFTTCCPFCFERTGKEDTSYHLGFNSINGLWNCYRCGARNSTHGQLKNLEASSMLSGNEDPPSIKNLRSKLMKFSNKNEKKTIDLDLISMHVTKEHTPFAHNYLMERGISQTEIEENSIRVGIEYFDKARGFSSKRWHGRILFPFMNEDKECTYLIGRSYLGKDPKYINASGSKKCVVYRLNDIKNRECIITEGLISAIAAERVTGVSAVCLLGKSNNDWALSRIRMKADTVYLSLDGGVDISQLRHKLIGMGFKVYEIVLPDGADPDDLKGDYLKFFHNKNKLSFF